jgi:hypothetical protein
MELAPSRASELSLIARSRAPARPDRQRLRYRHALLHSAGKGGSACGRRARREASQIVQAGSELDVDADSCLTREVCLLMSRSGANAASGAVLF